MIINYDTLKINKALKDFYNATNVDIDLLKPDFSKAGDYALESNSYCRYVQSGREGKKACEKSDTLILEKCRDEKKAVVHICHAGLVNVGIPILHNDIIIGYIMVGRMRADTDFPGLKSALKLSAEISQKYYNELPFFDANRIQSIANIATMFVKYLLLEDILTPDFNDVIEKAVDFINNDLRQDLSIKKISESIHVSKSVLYEKFHKRFNCTVSEYIKRKRVKKSVELLEQTNLSIEEISQAVGFSGASYYSKIFKKQMGVSPLKYKKYYISRKDGEIL